MKQFRLVAALLIIGMAAGCYNRAMFTPNSTAVFQQRNASWADIKIFDTEPKTSFTELGFLQGEFDGSVLSPSANIEELRKAAYSIGADAIIRLKCDAGSGWGGGYCQGTAIRFSE